MLRMCSTLSVVKWDLICLWKNPVKLVQVFACNDSDQDYHLLLMHQNFYGLLFLQQL